MHCVYFMFFFFLLSGDKTHFFSSRNAFHSADEMYSRLYGTHWMS